MTVQALIQAYRTAHPTVGRESALHARWWIAQLGKEPAGRLTPALLLRQLDRLASYGRSPSTVNFYFRFFRCVCVWGAAHGHLSTNPCAEIALRKAPRPTLRVLTIEEETRLCAALGSPYDLWVKFALQTGLKLSEQFSLRWREINFTQATLLLPDSSTGAAFSLPLSPTAIFILQTLRQSQPPSMWCFPDLKTPNRPVNVHSFLSWRWGQAVQQADMPAITWKDLRTTCGVRLAEQGCSVDEVVAYLRQAGNKRAYLYRCAAERRPPKVTSAAPPSMYSPPVSGELSAITQRDLRAYPVTFNEVARLYAVHHLGQRDSRRQFERMARQFWSGWGERPLDGLTKREVKAWYLEQSHIPGYANKALNTLRAMINWALDFELITSANPALRIKRFPAPARERFLSIDELKRMVEGLSLLRPKIRAYLLILLLTGARSGEARVLKWLDIDETSRIWTKKKTKNARSHRVPLPLQVMEALQEVPRVSEWVFPGRTLARPWSTGTARKQWLLIRRRWGLNDCTLHDLRRTMASGLAMHGENLPTIQAALGHRSLTPTAIYARLNTAALDRALQDQANRLGSLYAKQTWLPPKQPSDEAEGMPEIINAGPKPTPAQPPAAPASAVVETESGMEWPG